MHGLYAASNRAIMLLAQYVFVHKTCIMDKVMLAG